MNRRQPPKCSCGKVAFPNARTAQGALCAIRSQQAAAAAPMESVPNAVYKCGECLWWHFTSTGVSRASGQPSLAVGQFPYMGLDSARARV